MAQPTHSTRFDRRRFLRLFAAGVGGSALLAACSLAPEEAAAPSETGTTATAPAQASSAGKTTITVMHQRGELSEAQQQAFELDNSDITIAFVEYDAANLASLLAAGTPPDLFRVEAPDIPPLLARDLLLDLTPFFQTSTLINVQDLAPANNYYKANSPTDIGTGKIYGMVKDWSPDFTLFAYTKAFEQANVPLPDPAKPISYAELNELARRLTTRDGNETTRWGYAYPSEWIDRIMTNLLAEQGQQLYSDDFSKLNLANNPDALEIAGYFFNLSKDNLVPNVLNASQSWPGDEFTKGTVGLVQYGYWFSVMAESEVTKGNVVMLPAPTWSGKRLDPPMSATGMVMSRASKNPEAAWRVFEWYNAGQPAIERSTSGWGVPALMSKYDQMPTRTPFQQQVNLILRDELNYTQQLIAFNPYLKSNTFAQVCAKYLDAALRERVEFDRMIEQIEQEVNQAIDEGRKQFG